MRDLFSAIDSLKGVEEIESFMRDLCTLQELETLSHRWEVAKYLELGLPYLEIAERTGASTATVTRVAQWLKRGEGGYRLVLDKRSSASRSRSRAGSASRRSTS